MQNNRPANSIQVSFFRDDPNHEIAIVDPEEFSVIFDNNIDLTLPAAFFPLIEAGIALWTLRAREAAQEDDQEGYIELVSLRQDWRDALEEVKDQVAHTAQLRAN